MKKNKGRSTWRSVTVTNVRNERQQRRIRGRVQLQRSQRKSRSWRRLGYTRLRCTRCWPTTVMSLTSNFLDHLDGRLEKHGGRGSVARLLLVARKGEAADDPDAVVRYHEQVFEEILSEQHAATITGVLIVQKESVIHLVETSMDTSTAFLRQIQSMEADLDPSARVLENVKVLVSSEDCPAPYFAKWFHYDLQLAAESNVDIDKEDPVEASWGVYDKLVELASEMRQHSGTSVSELKRKYNHLVPSNERVMGLAETDNNMSLSEYLRVYDTPILATLESERVWPIPALIHY